MSASGACVPAYLRACANAFPVCACVVIVLTHVRVLCQAVLVSCAPASIGCESRCFGRPSPGALRAHSPLLSHAPLPTPPTPPEAACSASVFASFLLPTSPHSSRPLPPPSDRIHASASGLWYRPVSVASRRDPVGDRRRCAPPAPAVSVLVFVISFGGAGVIGRRAIFGIFFLFRLLICSHPFPSLLSLFGSRLCSPLWLGSGATGRAPNPQLRAWEAFFRGLSLFLRKGACLFFFLFFFTPVVPAHFAPVSCCSPYDGRPRGVVFCVVTRRYP